MDWFCFLLVLVVFLCGCVGENSGSGSANELCVARCREALASNVDLSAGPCLSNKIADDWVCDVAHRPRVESDNLLENRCGAFANGSARHFVELDLECNVIQVY